MATVTFDKITRHYPGAERPAVDALDLDIADGEFLVLVGPSGCGKTTSLRMLAGLEQVDDGRLLIDDTDITDVEPAQRDIAMVFQNYALYPHMTVAENMGFALKIAGTSKEERARRITEAARMLDLEQYLDRKPAALSGGQRQRVAMGRAIVRNPRVFLMDEPLSNLDAKLRVHTRNEISRLTRRLGVTTMYVTHDQVEAMTMGDRVAVLDGGVLQQVDTPRALYERPANRFVAGFIGSPAMSLVDLNVTEDGVDFAGLTIPIERSARRSVTDATVTVGVRPESVHLTGTAGDGLDMVVESVEVLGADAYLYGSVPAGAHHYPLTVRTDGSRCPAVDSTVRVLPDVSAFHIFDGGTGARLSA